MECVNDDVESIGSQPFGLLHFISNVIWFEDFPLLVMVWLALDDGTSPIDLFCKDQSYHLV